MIDKVSLVCKAWVHPVSAPCDNESESVYHIHYGISEDERRLEDGPHGEVGDYESIQQVNREAPELSVPYSSKFIPPFPTWS